MYELSNGAVYPQLIPWLFLILVGGLATLHWRRDRRERRLAQKLKASGLLKEIEELSIRMTDLEERNARLAKSMRKARMRNYNDEREEAAKSDTSQLPGETPQEWKARMRRKLAKGEISHDD